MKRLFNNIFLSFRHRKVIRNTNLKLKKIKANITSNDDILADDIINDYKNLFKPFNKKPSIDFLKCMVHISGIKSYQYIPEDIHYNFIEPVLNSRPFALAYNDKNLFENLLPQFKHLFPEVVLRGINGVIYDAGYNHIGNDTVFTFLKNLQIGKDFIVKPGTETGGGSNVIVVEKTPYGFNEKKDGLQFDTETFFDFLKTSYKGNFLVQKKILQSKFFSEFNESSLNTVRLYTYRSVKDEAINPLHAYLRFGNPNSFVDSSSQGGRTCGIFLNGKLNDFALGRFGEKHTNLEVLEKHKGSLVPKFHEMIQYAKEIAPFFKYHRLLGFDFSVDNCENVRLLEVNNLYIGVINQQMNTGPLFNEYTDEIIDFCSKAKRTFNYHFYY